MKHLTEIGVVMEVVEVLSGEMWSGSKGEQQTSKHSGGSSLQIACNPLMTRDRIVGTLLLGRWMWKLLI